MKAINTLVSGILLLAISIFAQAGPLNLNYSQILVDRNNSPTNEFIFSAIIETKNLSNPLGKYYMYYAPHDAPGGIRIAYADSIQGPYTDYTDNPILTRTHQNKFKVTHVSSPHVVWMPDYQKYFMYFHGENTTTRWAHSSDGLNWDLANSNISINTVKWEQWFQQKYGFSTDFSECSYARVFEYSIPGVGNRYVMMMMLIRKGYGRRIGLAISNDGKNFTPYDEAFISQGPGEGDHISGAFYWKYEGRHYVVYHGSSGNMHYTEVGPGFNQEIHHGIFYDPQNHYPEYNKAAAPYLIFANNRWNMFYDVGLRLEQTIAYAFETPTTDNVYVDNSDSEFSYGGSWVRSTGSEGYYGEDYLHDNNAGTDAGDWAKWKPYFPRTGYYKVLVRWPAYSNRPDNVKYKVYHRDNVTEVRKNQQESNGSWVYLGRYAFDAGSSESNRLTLDAGSDDGYTIADAAWFIYDGEAPSGSSNSSSSSSSSSSNSSSSSSSSSGTANCGGVPHYVDGSSYNAGDKVQNIGNRYECTVGGWCSIGGPYAPGTGWAWSNAWSQLGSCN